MAAVLTNHLSGGRVHVRSAGSSPSDVVNPAVIAVMAELGLDLNEEFPKPLTDDVVQAADMVVTMCRTGTMTGQTVVIDAGRVFH